MRALRERFIRPSTVMEGSTMAGTSVNNGVNVEALLAAREALKSAP